MTDLTQISIFNSAIVGSIPPDISKLAALQFLALDGAPITDIRPLLKANLQNLYYLYVFRRHECAVVTSFLCCPTELRLPIRSATINPSPHLSI
jgi:hypothetical protein